jgi:hypothetical protein
MRRCEPVGAFATGRCVPRHGNDPDSGLCDRCEAEQEKAREVRTNELRAALHAFAEQMPGQMWDYAVSNTLSAIVRSINMDGKCRLCSCYGECAPNCAATMLLELIDG